MAEFTPERLEQEVLRFRMTPQQAREQLLAVRAIIDGLLTTRSDVQRIRLYERFMRRLCRGRSTPDNLMYWSKIAGLTTEDVEKHDREPTAEMTHYASITQYRRLVRGEISVAEYQALERADLRPTTRNLTMPDTTYERDDDITPPAESPRRSR